MGSDRDPEVAKYAELKPKSPVDGHLVMSKVYTTRSWNLPPRSKHGRRPGTKSVADKQSREDVAEEASYDMEERKKRQNRDAQRAYRERRANRLLELEGVVESLQDLVKSWQKKYKAAETQLEETRQRVTSVEKENSILQQKLREISASAQVAALARHEEIPDADATLLDPLLQELIDNFKPMKAVTLKRRKVQTDTRSTASTTSHPAGAFDLTPVSASSVDCGFCSGDSTCVCKELVSRATKDDAESGCTKDISTCNQCSDIDQSCIKPQRVKEGTFRTAISRKRCASAPQGSVTREPLDRTSVSLQTSVSLGSESLTGKFCCTACGYKEKTPSSIEYVSTKAGNSVKGPDLSLLGIDHGEQPNTMDPNFVPGSCTKCQKDPQSRAFCQAIFGPSEGQKSDAKKSTCSGKGSCSKADP